MQAKDLGETALLLSNVQRTGNFPRSRFSIYYLRCLGVKQDGYQCKIIKWREFDSDETWSCRNHPQSQATECGPSHVWYRRCEFTTSGDQCKKWKSTTRELEAQVPWYCVPLHEPSQPQLDGGCLTITMIAWLILIHLDRCYLR